MSVKALEFLILTAARTGEVIGARWSEINLEDAVWIIPGDRMKGGRQHRIPLCRSAIELLRSMRLHPGAQEFVFCSPGTSRPISNMAMLTLIRRMGLHRQVTAHGFRSSFRDWAAKQTNFDHAVAEAALAHVPGTKVEQAYIRGDRFGLRQKLMSGWDNYLNKGPTRCR